MTKMFLLIVAFCLILTACGAAPTNNPAVKPTPEKFYTSTTGITPVLSPDLFDLPGKLQAQGLSVSPSGTTSTFSSVFHVSGYSLKVNEEYLVYYPFPDSASLKTIYISPEGATLRNKDGAYLSFSPVKIGPHVYIKDNLFVLYIGDNQTIINALQAVLGSQVAGM